MTTIFIPEVNDAEIAFGTIRHIPRREELPIEYQRDWHRDSQPFCKAISDWFYHGAKGDGKSLIAGGYMFTPKEGVDGNKALRAIKAAMVSWEPQHEHKIGACGWMLSEWFDMKKEEK